MSRQYYNLKQGAFDAKGKYIQPTHPTNAESLVKDVERGVAVKICEVEGTCTPPWGSGNYVVENGVCKELRSNWDSSD
jgi:hypothetical protein